MKGIVVAQRGRQEDLNSISWWLISLFCTNDVPIAFLLLMEKDGRIRGSTRINMLAMGS